MNPNHFNEYMHVYISNSTEKKYGEIFSKKVTERYFERLDDKGLSFSMISIL